MWSGTRSKATTPAPELTDDAFLGGRLRLLQPKKGHRAGSDAVFLAAATPARPGESVLDAGAGNGAAGLCLLARVPDLRLTAVDVDAASCALARENAARNGFTDRADSIVTDVTADADRWPPELRARRYDQLIANPPFHAAGTVRHPDTDRRRAYQMEEGGLARWIWFLTAMAAPRAWLTVIHRAEALPELLGLLEGRFGDLAVFPLIPREGRAAIRVIVGGRRGGGSPTRHCAGLVLHDEGGRYTREAEAILRHGSALDLATAGNVTKDA